VVVVIIVIELIIVIMSNLLTRLILKRIVGYNDQIMHYNHHNHITGLTKTINSMISSIDQYIHQQHVPILVSQSTNIQTNNNNDRNIDINSLLEGIWYMGVPKSKVSPSRKRMKHLQHVPDKIGWLQCKKCGEPKRPHRICTKHIDICAMRDDEYEAKKALDPK